MSDFSKNVYQIVKKIPKGKVATYGQITQKIKMQNSKSGRSPAPSERKITPRIVGFVLHRNSNSTIPCHRVVDRNGRIAPNFAFGGSKGQRERLLAENIKFKDKMHVDLRRYGWECH